MRVTDLRPFHYTISDDGSHLLLLSEQPAAIYTEIKRYVEIGGYVKKLGRYLPRAAETIAIIEKVHDFITGHFGEIEGLLFLVTAAVLAAKDLIGVQMYKVVACPALSGEVGAGETRAGMEDYEIEPVEISTKSGF